MKEKEKGGKGILSNPPFWLSKSKRFFSGSGFK